MANTLAKIIHIGHKFIHSAEYKRVWGFLTFPHRPTEEEINTYQKHLQKNLMPEAKCMILGATPELRDSLSRLGIKPILFDMSYSMLVDMLRYTKYVRPENETWIKANWLEIPFPENYFDIAVGDIFLRHIRPEDQDLLLSKINKSLRPGGRLITRHHIVNPVYRTASFEKILLEMSEYPYTKKKYEAMGILLSRLYDASTNNQRTDPVKIRNAIYLYITKRTVPLTYQIFLYEFIEKRLPINARVLASQTQTEFEKKIKQYFTITSVELPENYPEHQHFPIYTLNRSGTI